MTDTANNTKNKARSLVGLVVGNKMNKTATVLINRRTKHPVYGKYITRSSRFHVHDENNECKIGDKVMIAAGRPLSKTKSWMLLQVIERAEQP